MAGIGIMNGSVYTFKQFVVPELELIICKIDVERNFAKTVAL